MIHFNNNVDGLKKPVTVVAFGFGTVGLMWLPSSAYNVTGDGNIVEKFVDIVMQSAPELIEQGVKPEEIEFSPDIIVRFHNLDSLWMMKEAIDGALKWAVENGFTPSVKSLKSVSFINGNIIMSEELRNEIIKARTGLSDYDGFIQKMAGELGMSVDMTRMIVDSVSFHANCHADGKE